MTERILPYAIRQFEIDVLVPMTIFGVDVSFTISSQAMVTTVVLVTAYLLYGIRRREMVPGRLQMSVEAVYGFVVHTIEKTAGPQAKGATPFLFSLFVFLLFGGLIGLTPVKFTFTSHLVVTLALALTVFIYANTLAVNKHGFGFFKSFVPAGTPAYLTPIILLLETVSYLFRPVTLAVRIFANIVAGHIMVKIFADFCQMIIESMGLVGFFINITIVSMMVVLYIFEVMIISIQAYIFVLISGTYIKEAIEGH